MGKALSGLEVGTQNVLIGEDGERWLFMQVILKLRVCVVGFHPDSLE